MLMLLKEKPNKKIKLKKKKTVNSFSNQTVVHMHEEDFYVCLSVATVKQSKSMSEARVVM